MESSTAPGLESLAAEKSELDARAAQDLDPAIHSLAANGSQTDIRHRGLKRAADNDDDDLEGGQGNAESRGNRSDSEHVEIMTEPIASSLSKNQQRKLKKRKLWEEKKEDRVLKRKEKRHIKQERKRLEKGQAREQAAAEGQPAPMPTPRERDRNPARQTKVPVSVVLDCQYESFMQDKELVSLSSQVTRCYSDNRLARFPVDLCVSGFGGEMKRRYEEVLGGQHTKWKGIRFTDQDFVEAASQARGLMAGKDYGSIAGTVLDKSAGEPGDSVLLGEYNPSSSAKRRDKKRHKDGPAPVPEPEADDVDKSIVYLTADSPYVLERLEPNTTYVVGGIIDRNREKGLCYKVARGRNVRTAKLPIGEYMVLRDRHVLATNHVVEIILRWLELGDWGAAFLKVIPQRKGGLLKHGDGESAGGCSERGDVDSNADGEGDGKAESAEGGHQNGPPGLEKLDQGVAAEET